MLKTALEMSYPRLLLWGKKDSERYQKTFLPVKVKTFDMEHLKSNLYLFLQVFARQDLSRRYIKMSKELRVLIRAGVYKYDREKMLIHHT